MLFVVAGAALAVLKFIRGKAEFVYLWFTKRPGKCPVGVPL